MGDEPVRFGILGCANIAKKMSRAILGSPGTCLHAIGSRSLEKAQAFAKANGFPPEARVYGSYQSVLDDESVDAVYLPLPTSLHLEWVMKAIQRRKHVLLEKPAALSVEDLDKMLSACEKEGLQFMDCTMFMHHPRTARMKEVLGNKDLFSEILEVNASFCLPMSGYTPAFFTDNIRIKADLDGLGVLGDLGWYCARAILWAYDYELPELVTALPDTKFNRDGVLLSCKACLQWKDGRSATLHCSFLLNMVMKVSVYGSSRTLEVEDFVIPHQEHDSQFGVQRLTMFEPLDLGWKKPMEEMSVTVDAPQEFLMIRKFSSLVKAIKDGGGSQGPDPFWPSITRKTQQLLNTINSSIQNGCTPAAIIA